MDEECFDREFRSIDDDAWYSVRLLLEDERADKLRIKYHNFPDDHDKVFLAESFKSEEELFNFAKRFRSVSAQLQDRECTKIFKGIRVCASNSYTNGDLRFYDAVVDNVIQMKHSMNENGEEQCECVFLLCWLHGPDAGNTTDKGIESICRLQSSELDPKLESFMKTAMQKMDKVLCKPFSWKSRQGDFGNLQDIIVQEDRKCHIILVQNIEKGLSSSAISKFIRKQTSIEPEVYVFPSLPWQTYTNAVILLDCQNNFEKLFAFLQNPDFLIVSSNGRPWVVVKEVSMNHHWKCLLEAEIKLLNKNAGGFNDELKVVCCGTQEYETAKLQKDLFLQFIEHQLAVYKRLCIEEKNIS